LLPFRARAVGTYTRKVARVAIVSTARLPAQHET
jgi:hypothetical protein